MKEEVVDDDEEEEDDGHGRRRREHKVVIDGSEDEEEEGANSVDQADQSINKLLIFDQIWPIATDGPCPSVHSMMRKCWSMRSTTI